LDIEFELEMLFFFRLEYDACRTEIQFLSSGTQLNEKQEELEKYKDKYEQLKCSVNVKLKLLDENQVKFSLERFSNKRVFVLD
jgi:hypothetical protein